MTCFEGQELLHKSNLMINDGVATIDDAQEELSKIVIQMFTKSYKSSNFRIIY